MDTSREYNIVNDYLKLFSDKVDETNNIISIDDSNFNLKESSITYDTTTNKILKKEGKRISDKKLSSESNKSSQSNKSSKSNKSSQQNQPKPQNNEKALIESKALLFSPVKSNYNSTQSKKNSSVRDSKKESVENISNSNDKSIEIAHRPRKSLKLSTRKSKKTYKEDKKDNVEEMKKELELAKIEKFRKLTRKPIIVFYI